MITWAFASPAEIGPLSRWVANLIWPGKSREFGNCQGMAVIQDGALIAGAIFHNWEPDSQVIEISAAATSKRWLTRETLRKLFTYPFQECGCQAVLMRVADDNTPLHRMLIAYGFERYTIPRLRGRDASENIFVLTEEAWAGNKFNKRG